MPELPEVETVKETLKKSILNKTILDCKIYYNNLIEKPSQEEFIKKIVNQKIIDIKRRGKWLLIELNNYYLLSHLRMEGKFFINKNDKVSKHEHILFKLDDCYLTYHDTRKFGRMYLLEKDKAFDEKPLSELGLEPWDPNLTVSYIKDKFKNKRLPIKTLLLDQSVITGIGNIYDNEILFLCKINPYKKISELSDKDIQNIIDNTRFILKRAIELGGTTVKSFSIGGVHGLFQNELFVHTKSVCPECNNKITKEAIGGRGTYYCSKCQKI